MMKTNKQTIRFFVLLLATMMMTACSKDGEIGPIGPEGPQGEQGPAGPQGPAGIDGEAQGVPGPQGEQGPAGPQGEQGPTGAQGAQGPQGPAGPQGETGDQGPQGSEGPKGDTGSPGLQGDQGPKGDTGTANVIYSEWIASDFPANINNTFAQWEMFAPELTQEIHDTGVVLIFARLGTVIYPLPNSFFSPIQEHWDFRLLDTNDTLIAIRIHSIDGSHIGAPFLDGDFRYVIIPGGVASGGGGSGTITSKVDYSKMSYEEIARRFNIPD